tara:strand:- start:260972 stop:262372 length:1401 start_codon:yes stop_codon:yes gene_type:complete
MTLGDMDNDGDLDVIISTAFNVRIIPNNGDGTLGSISFISSSAAGGYIIIGDVDGINGADMCLVDRNRSHVAVMLNDGAGSFIELAPVSLGVAPFDGVPCDIDGDGDLDLAIVSENAGEFTIAINDGSGRFTALPPVTAGTFDPEDIAAADLDGDGDLDLGVIERTNNRLHLYTNDGSGGFTDSGISYSFNPGSRQTLTSVDIDQDGLVDFLLSSQRVVALLNVGDGTLDPQTPLPLGSWAESICAPDLDGDGTLDVVVTDINSSVFRYAFGNGDGTFTDASFSGASNFVSWAATGDMDGNGSPDVVVHTRNPGVINVFINQTDVVAPGPFSLGTPVDGAENLALPDHFSAWNNEQPEFRWSRPTGFSNSFDLSVFTTGDSPVEVYSAMGISGTAHAVPDGVLETGTEYAWDVMAINQAGMTSSTAEHLFETAPGPRLCEPDLTGDGQINFLDISAFIQSFSAGCP